MTLESEPSSQHRLLISFCNLPIATNYPLLAATINPVNAYDFLWQPVSLGPGITTHHTTGMTRWQDLILIAYISGGESWVSALDACNFNFRWQMNLTGAKDVHSIAIHQDMLLVVSSGTDQILAYHPENGRFGKHFTYWRASNVDIDTHHINSVISVNEKVYISSFGRKRSELWSSTSRNGSVYCIDDDEILRDNIEHPHTVIWHNEQVYFCESMKGTLNSRKEILCTADGYTRGIAWISNELVLFATSVGRTVSRSKGVILNPGDPGDRYGTCQIIGFNPIEKRVVFTENTEFQGPEIYDLLMT